VQACSRVARMTCDTQFDPVHPRPAVSGPFCEHTRRPPPPLFGRTQLARRRRAPPRVPPTAPPWTEQQGLRAARRGACTPAAAAAAPWTPCAPTPPRRTGRRCRGRRHRRPAVGTLPLGTSGRWREDLRCCVCARAAQCGRVCVVRSPLAPFPSCTHTHTHTRTHHHRQVSTLTHYCTIAHLLVIDAVLARGACYCWLLSVRHVTAPVVRVRTRCRWGLVCRGRGRRWSAGHVGPVPDRDWVRVWLWGLWFARPPAHTHTLSPSHCAPRLLRMPPHCTASLPGLRVSTASMLAALPMHLFPSCAGPSAPRLFALVCACARRADVAVDRVSGEGDASDGARAYRAFLTRRAPPTLPPAATGSPLLTAIARSAGGACVCVRACACVCDVHVRC
jgi:hypothetical protein